MLDTPHSVETILLAWCSASFSLSPCKYHCHCDRLGVRTCVSLLLFCGLTISIRRAHPQDGGECSRSPEAPAPSRHCLLSRISQHSWVSSCCVPASWPPCGCEVRSLPLSRRHVQGPRCNVSQLTYHLAAADRVQSTLFSRATVLYAQAWVLRDGCLLGLHSDLKGPCGASAGVEPITQHAPGCHTLASSCPGPFPP